MAIRRVTGAVSPSELIFADANALGATYDGSGTTIERGETFTLPSGGTTAVSNGALRLEALKGDCTITNNGNSTLTNASGVDGTIVMRSGASDFPAFVRNSSMGSMSTHAREDFTGSINRNATFPAGKVVGHKAVQHNQSSLQIGMSGAPSELDTDLRLTYTAKSTSNKLLFHVYAWFCSPNSSHLSWSYVYNVTDGATVNAPPTNGSRKAVHWAKRTTASDANDYDDMNYMVYADAPSGEKTYTIYYGTEGKTDTFYVSNLTTSSGVTAPITFSLTEIQQ